MSTSPSSKPCAAPGPAGLTRRQFVRRAAIAGGVFAAPLVIPSSALGRDGAVPPSERII
ncbi:MAG TPA: twin-arginine translocation signal domain-containing protein, partial [Candidatus Paceibacterota bacterium]|nr:twin-arginine translocation signal domain-containing protein [Candidatus Paceibacterota bacterium]